MAISKTILPNIRALSEEQLREHFAAWQQPAFRARQVHDWLWKKQCVSFQEMTNLPADLRNRLETHFSIPAVAIGDKQHSTDGTIKYAFRLHDNYVVEGVLIPANGRTTACVSSQVGCSLSCKFCATGKLKRMRNLEPDEIYDQVAHIYNDAQATTGKPLSNIVFMGMGEPLLNYRNVQLAIDRIAAPDGLGMAHKRITVSTAGIAKMIEQLGQDGVRYNLALSLHAANDKKRSAIMPINEQNSLEALRDALKSFYQATRSRVTFEYIIFRNFNDTIQDAAELAAFCRNVPCKVNIIEYNPIDGGEFQQAAEEKVDAFARYLEERNIIVNIRRSRGKDIDAACGQLANKNKAALKEEPSEP